MTKTKESKIPIYPISDWNVAKYSIPLLVNPSFTPYLNIKQTVSLDVEDDEKGNFVGLGMYFPIWKEYPKGICYYWSDWELIKQVRIQPFIAHNGITDLMKLKSWGFKVDMSYLIYDTQIMAHLLDSSRKQYGLKTLVKEEFGIEYPIYKDIIKHFDGKTLDEIQKIDPVLIAEYNACDTYWTYKLFEKQSRVLSPEGTSGKQYGLAASQYFNSLEKPCSRIFYDMTQRGIKIDIPYLQNLKIELETQKTPLENEIKNQLGDINLNSPKQLLGALNEKEIYPEYRGKASTDKRAFEKLTRSPIVQRLLEYSQVDTLLSSFIKPYIEINQEIIHPEFIQTGTRTGRISCRKPNLLNIPRRTENGKKVRNMFVARPGMLLGDCDYGQIEPRILAHFSKDTNLCRLFNDAIDFHTFTSENLRISRERAKVLNLSVGYRATFKSVSQQLKCTETEAQKEIDKWWNMFPGLYDWEQKLIYECRKTGYFETLLGRIIKVDNLNDDNRWKKEHAERQLINNIIQGSAAEVMKKAMISVDESGINILVQIYDELLFEENEEDIESALRIAVDCMETCINLNVPLVVDGRIGERWGDLH